MNDSAGPKIGFTLSSEEIRPLELVDLAGRAEQAGFDFAGISDHFHPWVDKQGNSPFVWAVLGGISQVTSTLRIGTGVTCPTTRIHPAIIAQAAATAASMLPGRFFLGVGAGENLNEHILGDRWPEADVRHERLKEAVEVIRKLWEGGLTSHHGKHYTVENARIYTLPDELPPIYVAAGGDKATDLAAEIGDGFVGTVPDGEVISRFEEKGGRGKPKVGQFHACWAKDVGEARRTALEWWPNAVLSGQLPWEVALPSFFEQATEWADEEAIAEAIVCGPDPGPIVEQFEAYADAGYDHIYVHQVGPDQTGFLDWAERELLPALGPLKG